MAALASLISKTYLIFVPSADTFVVSVVALKSAFEKVLSEFLINYFSQE